MITNKKNTTVPDETRSHTDGRRGLAWVRRGIAAAAGSGLVLYGMAATASAKPKPLPKPVTDGLDTVQFWVQTIAGSLAILGLLILFIGLFFASRHDKGTQFMSAAGWWLVGAVGVSSAVTLAPIFVG